MLQKGAFHEAAYFPKLFKLEENKQNKRVFNTIHQNKRVQEIWDKPMQFRKVDRSKFQKLNKKVNVIFVDSNEKAYEMIKALKNSQNRLGKI